jgi:Mrp family chromosome partitioning ATPase
VRLVSRALPPETPMGVGKTKLLLAALALAILLAIALPVALDLLDRRIRSVNDAEKLMGIPAAGWQVRTEGLATELFGEEQSRRFASTLIRNRARSERRTFAFTSVKPGAGVTTCILDTAHVLVRLGARVLVVEANAFEPCARFGATWPGLSDYLAGSAPMAELPRPFAWRDETLDVVAIGGAGQGGLRRLDRFQAAIAEWATQYDYVLVDLPPLLLSADAEMLIDTLGQVFLVLEADAVTRGEIVRAKRLLQKIDPEAVGLFVNKVPVFRGTGYMEGLIAETLTHRRFEHFMSLPKWKLWWEMLRAQRAVAQVGGSK